MTEVDSLHMVLLEFGDAAAYLQAEEDLGRKLTLHEVIAFEFATVRSQLEEVVRWLLDNVHVRPGFRELVERFRPVIVSSGFHELIEPVLAREGVEAELLANRLDPQPGGWRVLWRDETVCEVCGEACKRATLPAGEGELVYVGDGYSDRCAALAADRVFARAGLADYLEAKGVAYERFDDFDEIVAALGK